MIKREKYISPIREFYDSDLIKIITGIRRCGKSVILEQIKNEILESGKNVLELNFEDRRVYGKIKTGDDLIKYVDENKKVGEKNYLFFDEIQNLNGWQNACKTLRLDDNSIFITGSNSKLLSKEFTKELSGRYVSFRIKPFVYKEIKEYAAELNKNCDITDYLIWGGFPKRFEFESEEAQRIYLNDLDETIVLNDLINRYKIRKQELFKSVVNYILQSNARIYSVNSIKKYLKNQNEECSINTIIKYLGYLEEAYIIESIKQFSEKTKKELVYYKKIYNEDVCFNSLRKTDGRYDLTHNLENAVYNELVYMGYDLSVFSDKNKEIDFIAQKKNKKYYIQVAYSVLDEKTYEREFSAFKGINDLSRKIIITNDEIDYSTSTVKHIKLKDFLLLNEL